MKTLIALLVIVAIVGAVWLAGMRKASPPVAPVTTLEAPAVPAVHAQLAAGTPLAEAYENAAFVARTRAAVPVNGDTATTRFQLEGLQVAWFLNDYVMASKSNASVPLTVAGVTAAFKQAAGRGDILSERLKTYAVRDGTLADHYQATGRGPTTGAEFAAVTNAMHANGVPVNLDSDLLMDCVRYAAFRTDSSAFYGPKSTSAYPEALKSLDAATDTTFGHRFTERFGLSAEKASNLMKSLQAVPVSNLSDADMQVPAIFK